MLIRTIIILLILLPTKALADNYASDFLYIGSGVRATALGGAFVALADDSSACYWNPAGLSQLKGREIILTHASKFSGLASFDCIGYSQSLPIGSIGLNWMRFSVGEIPIFPEPEGNSGQRKNSLKYRPSAEPEGYISDVENALFLSYGKNFRINITPGLLYTNTWANLSVGGSLKLISQSLAGQRASGNGLDTGIIFRMDAGSLFDYENVGQISIGLNIQDINTSIQWNTPQQQKYNLPTNYRMGMAYSLNRVKHDLNISLARDSAYKTTVRFGIEYNYNKLLALRLGLMESDFSAGFGIKKGIFSVDYSYQKQDLAGSHQVGISINF
ncbi:PorV/PorQ family protein [Candidatus Poribacteria bacterium]|nr:PorV/PorQ family protein [Candidatus Poribacteria bacterium]